MQLGMGGKEGRSRMIKGVVAPTPLNDFQRSDYGGRLVTKVPLKIFTVKK
jgi:hypothetical protein